MVAAAIVGSAAVGAIGSGIAGNAAANAQESAANNASGVQRYMYDTARYDLQPYRLAGQSAMNPLMNLLGIAPNGVGGGTMDPSLMQKTLEQMPGYQFTLNQGLKSVQNSAASRGLGSSGAAMKGAADFATGLANQNYGNYFNQLFNVASMGQNAAAQTGTFGVQTGQSIGNNLIGIGNAQAANYMNMANAFNNATNSIGSYYAMQGLMGG